MKKFVFLFSVCAFIGGHSAFAQKGGNTRTVSTLRFAGEQETFEYTEAFLLESGHEMMVAPLVASVEVISRGNDGKTFQRASFTGTARKDRPSGFAGNEYLVPKLMNGQHVTIDIELLKTQAIYDFCRETDADLIVLPQFNIRHKTQTIRTTDDMGAPIEIDIPVERNGKFVMIVEAVGYPARYTNFRQGTANDKWIKDLYHMGQIANDGDHLHVTETVNSKIN